MYKGKRPDLVYKHIQAAYWTHTGRSLDAYWNRPLMRPAKWLDREVLRD